MEYISHFLHFDHVQYLSKMIESGPGQSEVMEDLVTGYSRNQQSNSVSSRLCPVQPVAEKGSLAKGIYARDRWSGLNVGRRIGYS